jgi:hypothetical protein
MMSSEDAKSHGSVAAWVSAGCAVLSVSYPSPIVSYPVGHRANFNSSQGSLKPTLHQLSSVGGQGNPGLLVSSQIYPSASALAERKKFQQAYSGRVSCRISITDRCPNARCGCMHDTLDSNSNFCWLAHPLFFGALDSDCKYSMRSEGNVTLCSGSTIKRFHGHKMPEHAIGERAPRELGH